MTILKLLQIYPHGSTEEFVVHSHREIRLKRMSALPRKRPGYDPVIAGDNSTYQQQCDIIVLQAKYRPNPAAPCWLSAGT